MEYTGNAIYDYVYEEDLDYYFSAEHTWMLVYGNAASVPKILVFANKVADINDDCTAEELNESNKALSIARYLNLPFIFVRFMVNSEVVSVWEESVGQWRMLEYDQLRDIYERYGVVQPGKPLESVLTNIHPALIMIGKEAIWEELQCPILILLNTSMEK